ncbi:ARM REPEAT PROTEIN INTERACTING WITH ABF2 [Trifolium repens]|nr:ARM REPEAT PROTEIN INTERACTING WITH ABF2 [Trifolium repens]
MVTQKKNNREIKKGKTFSRVRLSLLERPGQTSPPPPLTKKLDRTTQSPPLVVLPLLSLSLSLIDAESLSLLCSSRRLDSISDAAHCWTYGSFRRLAVSKIRCRWEGFKTLEKWVAGSFAGHSAFFLKDEMRNLWVGESGHENEKFLLYGEPNRSNSFTWSICYKEFILHG